MSDEKQERPRQLSIDITHEDSEAPLGAVQHNGVEDAEIIDEEPSEKVSLLSMAQRDLSEEDLDSDDDVDLIDQFDQEDTEIVVEAWATRSTQPFTPEQDFGSDERDDGDSGASEGEKDSLKNEVKPETASSTAIPFDQPDEEDDRPVRAYRTNERDAPVRSNALGDALGSTLGGAFGVLAATREGVRNMLETRNQKRQEMFVAQKMDAFHQGLKNLDESISVADGAANVLNETSLGKVKKSFKDQGLTPPSDVMREVIRSNPDAQAAFGAVVEKLGDIEKRTHDVMKLGIQAGVSSDVLSETIKGRMDEMKESLGEKLESFEDASGNPLTEKLKQLTKRIAEIIAAYVDKIVKSLLPSQE